MTNLTLRMTETILEKGIQEMDREMRGIGTRLAIRDREQSQIGGALRMIAIFGRMCVNPGHQARMMASVRTGGMVIAKMTKIEKEEEKQGDREVLKTTDATATVIGTRRVNTERGARVLEEAVMSHLGHVMKVGQKKEELKIKRLLKPETGGTKIEEGTVYRSGIGTKEPKQIWILNGWMHWSQRTRSRGTQKTI